MRLKMDEERAAQRERGPGAPEPRCGDEALVDRARAGDGAAFDALVRLHFARIHAFLLRLVGNHEDAEDLAQECFVRCHRSLSLLRGADAFTTWLYRIALHLSRDHMRAAGRRWQPPPSAADSEERVISERGPSDEAARRELLASLQAALERLPQRLQAAFVLRTFEGLAYDEVGRVLGITGATARVHVMKARRLLARWMEPWIGREEP